MDNTNQQQLILEKTKNAKKGIITGIINKVITLLIPFFVRTLFIKIIGIEYAGLNSLFASVLQVLNLAELGFASAVVYSMYKPIADRDDQTICALLNFYRKVYKAVGLVVLVVGLMVMPFLNNLINGTPPKDINLYVVYLIFLINTSISYLLYGYKTSLFNAYQRNDIINNISSITNIGLNLSHILVLFLLPNYYLYIIFIPFFTIANNLIVTYTVDKMYPQYKAVGNISQTMRKDIWKKISGLAIQRVCIMSRDMFSSIFISAFISLSIVGIYYNYLMILNALTGVMIILVNSIMGAIGNTVATTTIEENFNILKKFNCMFMWLSTIAGTCLFCMFQPFMQLWMGEKLMFGYSTVMLIVLYFYILRMGDIRSLWINAAGLFWEIRWRAVLEASLNLILDVILIQVWGVNGLLIGTILSLFFVNFLYGGSITFKYYFGYKRMWHYYKVQFAHLIIFVLSCIMSLYLCSYLERVCGITSLWFILLERMLLCVVFTNLLLYLSMHRTEDYRLAQNWIKIKIRKNC